MKIILTMGLITLSFLLITCILAAYSDKNNNNDDLYKLLGVTRDATVKEIRKAFKNLAVKLHPDKNKEDKDADSKFVKIARAYEILKDPDTRKRYDISGDTGEGSDKKQYHSYTYYRDHFGIYDDDPLIVTLSKADYEVNVLDRNQAWFINFYSPNCHHCHELAPIWRKLAVELEGVIRIGAVNCEEDWPLCYQLNIQSYPTLLYYEKEAHLYEGEHYRGGRTLDALQEFVVSKLTAEVKNISPENWEHDGFRKQQWLLFLCANDNSVCPELETRLKLAAILEGLMPVGLIKDTNLCNKIYSSHQKNPIVLWKVNTNSNVDETVTTAEINSIKGSDTKEILEGILNILPNPEILNEETFNDVRARLKLGEDKAWLICFYMGTATDLDLQLKRLPTIVPNINIGLVHCGRSSFLCSSLHVSRYPSWGVLKVGGAFELHHGRDVLHEVSAFARDSSKSTNLHALSPADFYNILREGSTWFIDWYAPWCPPCRKLMPEIRKASQHFDANNIQFGTVDCTLHTNLCSQEGIRSYPTAVLYNGSKTHYFHGSLSEDSIVDFVNDMLNPTVISLDENSFAQLLRKPVSEMWIVDYFAPWCGPCQRLSSEWRALAKQVTQFEQIKVAQVDCTANENLCNAQNIRGYPTIRLYPLGSKGLNTVAMYNGHRDALSLKRWLISFLPSPIDSLTSVEFKKQILTKDYYLPWLIDFYAPWCGHCIHFEPEFITVAKRLDGKVRTGKVDCEAERSFCHELRITSYPTVVLYLSPNEKYEISSQVTNEIVQKVKTIIAQHKAKYVHDEF